MPSKGTTSQRGYGVAHRKLRERYEPLVRSGQAVCARCNNPIPADADWDLGHNDDDPTHKTYNGPEHIGCNRATKGRKRQPATTETTDASRAW
jgi:hypothetical protein